MSEHIRITRNRREFLTNAFCGFGSIAMADLLARSDARAYPKDGYGVGIGPIDEMKIPVIEMYWETYSERIVESPTGRVRLRCESSGIDVLASPA